MRHTQISNQVRNRNLNASPSKDPDKLFKKFCFRFSLSWIQCKVPFFMGRKDGVISTTVFWNTMTCQAFRDLLSMDDSKKVVVNTISKNVVFWTPFLASHVIFGVKFVFIFAEKKQGVVSCQHCIFNASFKPLGQKPLRLKSGFLILVELMLNCNDLQSGFPWKSGVFPIPYIDRLPFKGATFSDNHLIK